MKTQMLSAQRPEDIAAAAGLLRNGKLVAIPTETVYGLGANGLDENAVLRIFEAKGRPQDNPLIVHVTGPEMLHGLVSEVPERAQLLMAAFCPGPLTIIMPRGPEVAAECCAGLDTVGIRMPSHPVARAVIEASGCAFAAPSANLSGKPSPTNAQDVFTDMDGRLPLILDGGECDWGVESTVVSVVGEKFFICSSNSLLQISRIFSMHLFLLSSNKADSATYCASMSISASETTPVSAASIVSSPCLFIMRLCTSISSSCGEVTPSDIRLTTFL